MTLAPVDVGLDCAALPPIDHFAFEIDAQGVGAELVV